MAEYQLTLGTLQQVVKQLQIELDDTPLLVVTTRNPNIGKWGMARLWRAWMSTTADFMAARGVTMPLMLTSEGSQYGSRPFSADDAHELFTAQWLGVDAEGKRLSWSRSGRDDMRPADKGERFSAMQKHEQWAIDKGLMLIKPRESEYAQLEQDQEQ